MRHIRKIQQPLLIALYTDNKPSVKQALAPVASDMRSIPWPVAAVSQGLKPSTALDKAG